MNAQPVLTETKSNYSKFAIGDSCTVEVIQYQDSTLFVETVCAPICSSRAHMYDKENKLIRIIPPTCQGIFPCAYIENGQLFWRDNTINLLDGEEKSRLATQ